MVALWAADTVGTSAPLFTSSLGLEGQSAIKGMQTTVAAAEKNCLNMEICLSTEISPHKDLSKPQ